MSRCCFVFLCFWIPLFFLQRSIAFTKNYFTSCYSTSFLDMFFVILMFSFSFVLFQEFLVPFSKFIPLNVFLLLFLFCGLMLCYIVTIVTCCHFFNHGLWLRDSLGCFGPTFRWHWLRLHLWLFWFESGHPEVGVFRVMDWLACFKQSLERWYCSGKHFYSIRHAVVCHVPLPFHSSNSVTIPNVFRLVSRFGFGHSHGIFWLH